MKSFIATVAFIAIAAPALANMTTSKDSNADNTATNKTKAVTAQDQSNATNDVELTRQIRSNIVKDKSLSTNAHNIKIVTANGKVTLVGPVKSSAEKAKIESIAKTAAGTLPVDSQITVAR